MTTDMIFDAVRTHLAVDLDFDFTAGAVMCLLVDAGSWTPSESDAVVGDILTAGATEAAITADRQTLTTPTAALSGTDHLVYWDSDPVVYPGVASSTPFTTLVLFRFVTNDTDSWLIAAFDLGSQSGDGSDVTINPDSLGWLAW